MNCLITICGLKKYPLSWFSPVPLQVQNSTKENHRALIICSKSGEHSLKEGFNLALIGIFLLWTQITRETMF